MMIPLKQFICDTCGGVIQNIQVGWMEWLSIDDPKKILYEKFRICHHENRCMKYANDPEVNDGHLEDFLDEDGRLDLLSMIDPGPFVKANFDGPSVVDLRQFMEIYRRLTIPYYEEARQYFNLAKSDGMLEDCNGVTLYKESMLCTIIKNYSTKNF